MSLLVKHRSCEFCEGIWSIRVFECRISKGEEDDSLWWLSFILITCSLLDVLQEYFFLFLLWMDTRSSFCRLPSVLCISCSINNTSVVLSASIVPNARHGYSCRKQRNQYLSLSTCDLGSLIMEGFKEQMVRDCLKLPKRYQIAGILSFGYEPDNTLMKPSARFTFGISF